MKKTFMTLLALSAACVVCSGQATAANMTTGSDNYTVSGSDTLRTADEHATATLTGTITVEGKAIFAPSSSEVGASYSNVWISASVFGPISSSGVETKISGADITIIDDYQVRKMNLTESKLTIASEGKLEVQNNANYYLSLGDVTVEAGGELRALRDAGYLTYNGAIDFSLADTTLTGTGSAYTTNALGGTLNDGSSLTLNFSAVTALQAYTGTTLTITLTGLDSSSLSSTANVFSVDGWDVAATAGANTVLTLTKQGAAIPEPTTATLSLLALAGLAARRRRK